MLRLLLCLRPARFKAIVKKVGSAKPVKKILIFEGGSALTSDDIEFLALRRCMREPILEIFEAAELLNQATDAHCTGAFKKAESLIKKADMPAVRAFTESLWGSARDNPDQQKYRRRREVINAPPFIASTDKRHPGTALKKNIVAYWGRYCLFCGMPLIRPEVIRRFNRLFPEAAYWEGNKNLRQHAAFQCMWLQYDHVLPHSRGGGTTLENLIVTCAPCNYGRSERTLEEVGLIDPRNMPLKTGEWDGLERILAAGLQSA